MKSSGESSRQGKDQVREKSTERDGYMDMKKGFEIVHCTCNHQENVLGVDRLPCFGWQMRSDEPGDIQTAGRIIVSADFDNVQMGKGDVWDSGWIEGSENVSVSYQGKALEPRTRYYWRVMAKNRSGETAQSAISFFETGNGRGLEGEVDQRSVSEDGQDGCRRTLSEAYFLSAWQGAERTDVYLRSWVL